MSNFMEHPNWILGCQKSKIINLQKLDERRQLYYKNPKLCKYCKTIISYEKRDNVYCNSRCAGFLSTKEKCPSTSVRNKNSQNELKHNKSNFKIIRLKKCRICGDVSCKRHEICSKRRLFPTLSKYFGFDLNLVGSLKIYDEWDRIRCMLYDDYNTLNLSSIEIAKKYNYYDAANMCGVLTRLGIQKRTIGDSLSLAFSEGRLNIFQPNYQCYKHGWHTSWDNKQVYFRSSLEKIICEYLDTKHIAYEVETKRIRYWSSIKNSFHISIPDFYLPKYNLLVEAKGSYFYNEQDINDRKKSYIENGYDFRLYLENQKVEDVLGDLI